MKTIKLMPLFVMALFLLSACGREPQESSQTIQITQPTNGNSLRLLTISSDEFYINVRQEAVISQLLDVVNGGNYNIVSVKTSYMDGYLVGAQITYDSSGSGDGNKLRVLVIVSDKFYHYEKNDYVQPKLDEAVNSGEYNIVSIQTTYASGQLVAAELYYRVK